MTFTISWWSISIKVFMLVIMIIWLKSCWVKWIFSWTLIMHKIRSLYVLLWQFKFLRSRIRVVAEQVHVQSVRRKSQLWSQIVQLYKYQRVDDHMGTYKTYLVSFFRDSNSENLVLPFCQNYFGRISEKEFWGEIGKLNVFNHNK